jgi:hypothetical protein
MTGGPARAPRLLFAALVAPGQTAAAAAARPAPGVLALALVLLLALAGALTLPPVIRAFDLAFAGGEADLVGPLAAMRTGILRLLTLERVLPPPTPCIAAVMVSLAAEPVLSLPRDRRRAIAAVAVLGLAPLLVERSADLLLAHVLADVQPGVPGEALGLASRFVTGPLLLWRDARAAPAWLETLDARCNLVLLWCVALWATGLRVLDDRPIAVWHVGLPLTCLAGAGVVTWVLGPTVLGMILGVP